MVRKESAAYNRPQELSALKEADVSLHTDFGLDTQPELVREICQIMDVFSSPTYSRAEAHMSSRINLHPEVIEDRPVFKRGNNKFPLVDETGDVSSAYGEHSDVESDHSTSTSTLVGTPTLVHGSSRRPEIDILDERPAAEAEDIEQGDLTRNLELELKDFPPSIEFRQAVFESPEQADLTSFRPAPGMHDFHPVT